MPKNVATYFDVAEKFAPDVINGGSPTSRAGATCSARTTSSPVLSGRQRPDAHPLHARAPNLAGHESAFRGWRRRSIKPKVAGAFHYLITTFFYPEVRKQRTTLAPPILRPQILAAERGAGRSPARLPDVDVEHGAARACSAATGRECRIYGLRRDIKQEVVEGNLRYRPFSEDRLHRRPAHRARRDRQQRLHADGRGRLPAPSDAGDPGRRPVRTGAERALPGSGRLRRRRQRADRGGAWARSWNASPTSSASWPAIASTATPSCWPSWTTCWCRRRRRASADSAQALDRGVGVSVSTHQSAPRSISAITQLCPGHSVRRQHGGEAASQEGTPVVTGSPSGDRWCPRTRSRLAGRTRPDRRRGRTSAPGSMNPDRRAVSRCSASAGSSQRPMARPLAPNWRTTSVSRGAAPSGGHPAAGTNQRKRGLAARILFHGAHGRDQLRDADAGRVVATSDDDDVQIGVRAQERFPARGRRRQNVAQRLERLRDCADVCVPRSAMQAKLSAKLPVKFETLPQIS